MKSITIVRHFGALEAGLLFVAGYCLGRYIEQNNYIWENTTGEPIGKKPKKKLSINLGFDKK